MRDEGSGRGTSGQRLQHRGFDLQEPTPLQKAADRAHHGDALPGHRPRLWSHDQIHVALPDPRFLAEFTVCHRQRS